MNASLYPRVWGWDNLLLAHRKASKGKRGKPPAAAFEYHLEDNLVQLQTELRAQSYQPGPYASFYIHEPKRRLISAAPFRDRVVHHALCNVIEPLFERRFIFDSYANRVGKGTHRALDRCQEFARKYRYVLPCDVRQFFPSIDHAVLWGTLGRVIADEDVMWLVDRILASGVGVLSEEYEMVYFPGDDLFAVTRPRGLPIGNLTSQFTDNFPRSQRFFVTQRLRDNALDFQELIIEANNCRGQARLDKIDLADAALDKVRIYLRMSCRWKWLKPGQYRHAAGMVAEIGRLLGGWKKTTRQ